MDAWYTLYFIIPAVLMPMVCLRNDPSSMNAANWRSDIFTAQNIIKSLIIICPAASKILDLIELLGSEYLRRQDHGENIRSFEISRTDESPLSQLMQLHSMLWPVSFDIEQQFKLA